MKHIAMLPLLLGAMMSAPVEAQERAPRMPPMRMPRATPPDHTAPVNPRALAAAIADTLTRDYVFADIAPAYGRRLKAEASRGAYDQLSGSLLAERLTRDLNAVHADGHLRVGYGNSDRAPMQFRPRNGAASGAIASAESKMIEQAEWIVPGIAFIRFNEFPDDITVTAAVASFMRTHANAKTIIFDLRTNRGGGTAPMNAIFPYLYSQRTRLATIEVRGDAAKDRPPPPGLTAIVGKTGYTSFEHWVDPGAATALHKASVMVLTSPRTGSAGEHFTAAMKWSGRGTIIGTATAGANHIGSERDLGGGFTLFVPEGRTFNPSTGEDWEGTGVAPDIVAQPEDALRVALIRAGVAETDAAQLSAAYRPSQSMERMRRP